MSSIRVCVLRCTFPFQVGSKYLLFGGADSSQQHFADIHSFDPATRCWEKVRGDTTIVYVIRGVRVALGLYRYFSCPSEVYSTAAALPT